MSSGTGGSQSVPVLRIEGSVRLARAVSGLLIDHPFPGSNRLRRMVATRLMPQPTGPVIVPTEEGCSLLVDPSVDRGLDRELFYQGVYEAGTLHVMRHLLRPGDVFLDVGANVGLMTVVAARFVGPKGRVYAFEPVQGTARLLERNVALNNASNVEVVPMALGARRERRVITEHLETHRGAASFATGGVGTGSEEVQVDTLDAFVRERRLEGRVRLVKIDVEGWEEQVLVGGEQTLRASTAPALIVEYSMPVQRAAGRERGLYETIRSLNDYRVFGLQRGKEVRSRVREIRSARDLPVEDNLICLRPHHLTEEGSSSLLRRS